MTDSNQPQVGDKFNGEAPYLSELDLAFRFVTEYGQWFRWTPGMDWMVNEGTHWTRDTMKRRWTMAKRTCALAAATADKTDAKYKIAKAATVAATVRLAESDMRISVPVSAWDADPVLLNTPDGAVDLRTGAIRPRSEPDYFTKVTRVAPQAGGRPLFDKFLARVLPDPELRLYVQRVLGYCLTGLHHIHELYFWYGAGRNGKNTLLDLVVRILGEYATELPAMELMTTRNVQHPAGLADLQGRRLAWSSELNRGQHWNESLISALTGNETFKARFMQSNPFTFRLTQKHIIVANHYPSLHGGDQNLRARFRIIPFDVTIPDAERDAALPGKLWDEAPQVLAWLMEGAQSMLANGLPVPACVRERSEHYLDEQDDMELWMEERCERGPGKACQAIHLFNDFVLWKEVRKEVPPSLKQWSLDMQKRTGITKERKSSGFTFRGVTLRTGATLQVVR